MQTPLRTILIGFCWLASLAACAQNTTVILSEPGFPAADSVAIADQALKDGFAETRPVSASELSAALEQEQTWLLVLPYGSAYPEEAWPAILRFLDRGGDLIVLGGKPFTRAAYKGGAGWQLRAPSVAASLELFIHDYQATPGSDTLRFEQNPDVRPRLPAFHWKQAFSPVIRLSVTPMFPQEGGSLGNEDADLTTLAWGDEGAHHRAAPVFLVDHHRLRFVGGRWIFLACTPSEHGFDDAHLLAALQTIALRKHDRFTFRPRLPLFLPGEALEFQYEPSVPGGAHSQAGDSLDITVKAESGAAAQSFHMPAESANTITLPPAAAAGQALHTVEATLLRNGAPLWTYRSAFWMRDLAYLQSGPKLAVGSDYFELDGKPLPVVGTTYMASDVHRLFLAKPNAYVWNRDMAQIRNAGLNMIRSGIWSGWDLLVTPDKALSEDGLRTIEAFLMTARHNSLPVQFNLFAFLPDSLGGESPYLDPVARQAQDRYVSSLVERFHNVPFLAWDLINEPSLNKNVWSTLPHHDAFEETAWRSWLKERYPDERQLLADWAEPSFGMGRVLQSIPAAVSPSLTPADPLALPDAGAFGLDGVRSGFNPLKDYDYWLFTQKVFIDWVRHQRETIRAAGSHQLVTVGQDEGGVALRLSPSFFSPEVDFTTDHTWWDYDAILWASLAAKFPGKPMLVQELGEQRRLTQDDHLRLSAEEEGWQLERKLAIAFAQGAGGLEWVWDVNPMMANDNEIPIGAIRPDGTEKPEADVLAGFAQFAGKNRASFTAITAPYVTLVTSQSLLYTGMNSLALGTQERALRALAYYDHTPARMLPENRLEELGQPKLVLLPAPQALTSHAWQQLLGYVERGGCLLVSGPVQRDEHWQWVDRLAALNVQARVFPLDVRQATLRLPQQAGQIQLTFPAAVQQAPIETMRFAHNAPVEVIPHGAGKILWAADPVEFSEGYEAAAALYAWAESVAEVQPAFRELQPLSPGVLAFPTVLKDAVLYSFSSESLEDEQVNIQDAATGAHLNFRLKAQHGALALLRKPDGAVLASYGIGQ